MGAVEDLIAVEKVKTTIDKTWIKENIKECKEILDSNIDDFIVNAGVFIQGTKRSITLKPFKCPSLPTFILPSPDKSTDGMFGSLKDGLQKVTAIKMKILQHFVPEIKQCHIMAIASNGSLWIVHQPAGENHLLQNVLPRKNVLQTVKSKTFVTPILDIALIHNRLLITDSSPTLKILDETSWEIKESKYYIGPSLLAIAVHITLESKVVVSARSPGTSFPVSGRRVVFKMNEEGQHEAVWEYDENNKRIFSIPRPETSTKNGNIFVTDYTSDISSLSSGRILVLGEKCNIENIYEGHPIINSKDKPLTPSKLVTTPYDNVLVSDQDNHYLHLLDNMGSLLTYFDMSKLDISFPCCMAFDENGTLYIGCNPGDTSKGNGKLYMLQYSEH